MLSVTIIIVVVVVVVLVKISFMISSNNDMQRHAVWVLSSRVELKSVYSLSREVFQVFVAFGGLLFYTHNVCILETDFEGQSHQIFEQNGN